MDKNRLLMIGVILAIVVVAGLGYVLGVQPQLAAAQASDLQRSTIAAQNATTEADLAKMRSDYSNLGALKAKLATLQTSIPSSPALDKFLQDVYVLASSTGATVTAFTPADAVAYVPPVAPVTAPAATGTTSGSSPSPTPSPSLAPAAPAAPQAPAVQSNPLITAQNFVAIPVKIGIQANDAAAFAFLDKLQKGKRLFLVTSFSAGGSAGTATPGSPSAGSTYTIGGYVYVLASPKAGSISPGAAGSTSTSTSTSTPTPTSTPKP